MNPGFTLSTHRALTLTGVALLFIIATCVEQPISPLDPGVANSSATATVADSGASAAVLSTAITHSLLTSGNDPVNQKVYTTASISPAPNALVTVAVMGHNSTSAAPSPTLSGGGMSGWTVVETITFDDVATPLKRLTIYRAMSPSPGSGPLTITFSKSQSNCQWIVSQWDGVDSTGVNGAGAIVQSGSTRADAASGLAVRLGAFGDANNVAYGVFGVRSSALAVSPGAGFTEITEQASGESPRSALEAEWATSDSTIDARWVNLNGAALGVEIRAAAGSRNVSAAQSTVTASSSSIIAGNGTATITVTAKDASGTPISGATVVLSATGTGNTLTQPPGPTGANGVATGTLSTTVAETRTISATINGTSIIQTATVTATPGPVSATQSTVAAAPTSIAAGSGASTITVTAKDDHGNPISGATVVLAATGNGSALTQPAGPTDSNGVATGAFSSTAAGTAIVSATISGTAITRTATVATAVAHHASAITHTLLTSGNNPVNQKVYTTAPISPAPNALVTVAVLGHNSTSAAPPPTLSGGGMSAWTVVETITFDAVATPLKRLTIFRAMSSSPGSGPLTITFSSNQSHSQWIVSQWEGVDATGVNGAGAIVQTGSTRADAGNGLAVTLGAFGDAHNVAYGVFGVRSSTLAVSPGSGFAEIAEQPSGESPHSALQAEWTTSDNTIDARWVNLNGAALGVEIRAGNTGPVTEPVTPVASVEVSPASASVPVGGAVQLNAALEDSGGEPVTGRTVIWGTSAPQVATVSATGLVTGVAAGLATITATSEGKVGTSSVTVTATTQPVASVEVIPGTASVSVGSTVQLTATAKNAAGAPLTGRTFTWGTDAPGVATVSAAGLVTSVKEGTAKITATSEGKSGTATVTVTSLPVSAFMGEWSPVMPSPIIQVHLNLLLDGRVLSIGQHGHPQVWNPATGLFTAVPSPALVFCGGHDFLPDGRLLVAGGHIKPGFGLAVTNIFDFATASWKVAAPMAQGRWYPTNVTLPSGEMLTISGEDQNGILAPIPEIWNGTSWRQLTGANLTLPNYPRMFVAPDGRLFYAGIQAQSRFLDVTGAGSWSLGPTMKYGSRQYGSAVMYEPGKIVFIGGKSTPTNTAEIIDLNQSNPQWNYTGSMSYARWNLNATVLPTGEVLVTGGVGGERGNAALAVNAAELWNPANGTWKTLASSAPLLRGYHSASLLLPDGRVLHAGGGEGGGTIDNFDYEVYSPPYLFKGARPTVTGATPGVVGYGQTLSVQTPDGASIAKVSLIRFGSVTHSIDMGQRLVPLNFTQTAGGLSVKLPTNRAAAPPGPYMLFLVNGNGVPSVARIMRLQ